MKIQVGQIYMDKLTNKKGIYPNKTKKYLLPCLKAYGKQFESKINSVFKVAVGLGDMVYTKAKKEVYERHLFILLDSSVVSKQFKDFIKWIREQIYYEDDYVYGNIQKSSFHMVIIKFPEEFCDSLSTFKKGKYSEMFKEEKGFKFFETHPEAQKVLIKDRNYKVVFVNKVNTRFDTTITPEEWEGELDYPPKDANEVFNHYLTKR